MEGRFARGLFRRCSCSVRRIDDLRASRDGHAQDSLPSAAMETFCATSEMATSLLVFAADEAGGAEGDADQSTDKEGGGYVPHRLHSNHFIYFHNFVFGPPC